MFKDNLSVPSSLTPEDGTDRLSRNVGKDYHYSLRNDPEERSSQLLRGGSRKSRMIHKVKYILRYTCMCSDVVYQSLS